MSRHLMIAGLLFLAVLAAFGGVLDNGFVGIDDNQYVTENPAVRAGLTWRGFFWALTSTDYAANWHPLTWLSHMADVSAFGLRPRGHHLTSLVLHAANAALIFLVLRGMTGALWPSSLAAAFFALHPLGTESVAWVAERKNVISTLLWFAVMAGYLRYARRPSKAAYAAVAGLLALGLAAKPMLVILPFVLLLLDYWPLGRIPRRRAGAGVSSQIVVVNPLMEKLPLLALSAASGMVTYAAQFRAGATTVLHLSAGVRAANAVTAYAAYLRKCFWPSDLAVYYPHPAAYPALSALLPALVLLAAVSGAVIWLRRRAPYLTVGWLWFLAAMLPVIGLVQVGGQAMADRYMYAPGVGLFVALAWSWSAVGRRYGLGVQLSAAIVCLGTLGLLSWHQVHVWRDSGTLFRRALELTRDNHLAHLNLANFLLRSGEVEAAMPHYREVKRLTPDNIEAYVGLGVGYALMGRIEDEIDIYRQALTRDPNNTKILFNLGVAYEEMGMAGEAQRTMAKAVALSKRESNSLWRWGFLPVGSPGPGTD